MALQLGLEVSQRGRTTVALAGELDAATVSELDQVWQAVAGEDADLDVSGHAAPAVALDLGGLEFVDSHGLDGILALRDRCAAAGGDLVLVRPSRLTRHMLRVLGADIAVVEPTAV